MGKQQESKRGRPPSAGKRPGFFIRYFAVVEPERKLRHLLKRNGIPAARKWAEDHDKMSVYRRLRGLKGEDAA